MHPRQAGPSMERLWADEVRYLHALWHRGPPRDDAPEPKPSAATGLGPSSSTRFKKAERRRKRKEEKMQSRVARKLAEQLSLCSEEGTQASDPSEKASSSVIEWPCEPPPVPAPDAGWGDISQKPAPSSAPPLPPSQEEQEKIAALRVQQKAIRACQGFLSGEGSSDGEEEEDEEDDDQMDEDGDGGGENREGSGYFNFFLGLFEGDSYLRAYYEKNWEKGEFCCLVCEGIGVKAGKKFVDCVALVQHSSSIKKTKRKKAHREFGRAICRVLGWDITRLPSIVLDMGETLGQTLAKATGLQLDIPRESDQISVDSPEAGGTEPDDHGNCLEADDIEGRLTHSRSIGKTEEEAHRALGRAICCVLGWIVTRLPIAVDMREALGQMLKATDSQVSLLPVLHQTLGNILKQDDEITGQVSQGFGTDHDSHIAYPEADEIHADGSRR